MNTLMNADIMAWIINQMYLLCQTCPNLDVVLRIFISVRKTIRKYAYMSY